MTKFQGKFQQETQRSVGQFQRFQDSLRDSQARDVATGGAIIATTATAGGSPDDNDAPGFNDVSSFDTGSFDTGSFDTGSFDAGSAN